MISQGPWKNTPHGQSHRDLRMPQYVHARPELCPRKVLPAQPAELERGPNAVRVRKKEERNLRHATSKELRAQAIRKQGVPR
jgi:hypothetical protein